MDALSGSGDDFANTVRESQTAACKKSELASGETVFPGRPTKSLVASHSEQKAALTIAGKDVGSILISACVGYRFSAGSPYGHTGASLGIAKNLGAGFVPMTFLPGEKLQRANLRVLRLPLEVAD
jgi:hypothetical protein